MASIPGSVRVGGFIAPSDTTDTYATHDSLYGRGGLKEVASVAERDAIPSDRRREGMIVYVGGVTQTNYQLVGGVDNTNWVVVSSGSGGVTDHGALTGLSDDDHTQYLNETRHDLLDHSGLTGIPSITGLLDEIAHDALDHTGLTGIPAAYSLPTASITVLGGVKVDGTTVTISNGVISSSGSGMTNPMTAAGDIIYGGTSGTPTRLAKGTDGQVLTLASGLPSWADASGCSAAIDWANPVSVTTTANLTIGKHHVCSGTTADYTVTLPAVSGNSGKLLSVEMSGALTKLVTLDGNASETIDGATTRVMWARETAVLLCDGTGWTKVGGKSIPMAMKAHADTSAQLFAAATFAKISLATEVYDYGSFYTPSTVTIRRGGIYIANFGIRYNNNNATNTPVRAVLYIDGVIDLSTYVFNYYTANSGTGVVGASWLFLSPSQTVELYGYFNSGSFATSSLISGSTLEKAINLTMCEVPQW